MTAPWPPYPRRPDSTVVGDLRLLPNVASPQLGGRRDLLALLPPSHGASDHRYPVLYMHDGHNLFDGAASFSGEWRVDETMADLAREGLEAIVVGIPNGGPERAAEYTPHPHPQFGGGRADAYVAFLTDTVKPLVDAAFRTEPGRGSTFVAGSSLGGLVSLYAALARPDVFSRAGVFSPAFWWNREGILDLARSAPDLPQRVYLDVGGREAPERPELNAAYVEDARDMVALLRGRGLGPARLRFVEDPEAPHHESAWAARLPDALRFLLAP